jgi:hypothetical protein
MLVVTFILNATFNNISAISWQSLLLVEETGENHWPVTSHWQTLSHNVVSRTPRLSRIRTHNISGVSVVVISSVNSMRSVSVVVISSVSSMRSVSVVVISSVNSMRSVSVNRSN